MKKILIVHQDEAARKDLGRMVENAGYACLAARQLQPALELAREAMPDLVVVDGLMPEGTAYALCKELKARRRTALIPVLIILENRRQEDAFRSLGVDAFIVTPVDEYYFLSRIAGLASRPAIVNDARPYKKPAWVVPQRAKRRVVVAGDEAGVVDCMVRQLRKNGYQVEFVYTRDILIEQCLVFVPNLIIMDVQWGGTDSSADLIRALRQLPHFREASIIVYNFYRVEELGSEAIMQRAEDIDACAKKCAEAGATRYIGRFSEQNFLQGIAEYL